MQLAGYKSYGFEELEVGMEASYTRTLAAGDITTFADVSGDTNPLHLDPAYAATTIFKAPIAHGMHTAGYISTVFGTIMPGPGAIYVSQTLNFRGPVRAGDTVIAKVKIVELFAAKNRARFECVCTVNGKSVLEGEAILMVPSIAKK